MKNEFTRKGSRIYRNGELWCKFLTKHGALCAVVKLRLSPEYKHLRLLTPRASDETICACSHDVYENVVNPGHCMACGKPFRR